jgi:glycosyltransferase involved in cell wall biosynthesis
MTRAARPGLVTVIVPAYNAAATIDETLRSVRAQTWRDLEILVVDDGSRDGTAGIALRHAEADPRLRPILQKNAGVAAARNRGIEEARGEFVAPVDADDLWHPHKIERQLQAVEAAGPGAGLAYSWYALIDANGCIISTRYQPDTEGDVFQALCRRGNIVGNGSSTLIRRSVALEVGGYDASLRARQAQGCEDYKIYLQIAERYRFALVRDHLTGYRIGRDNMSGDLMQMLRSFDLVVEGVRSRHPERAADLRAARNHFLRASFERASTFGQWMEARSLAAEILREDSWFGARTMLRMPVAIGWRMVLRPAVQSLAGTIGGERGRGRTRFLAECAVQAPR